MSHPAIQDTRLAPPLTVRSKDLMRAIVQDSYGPAEVLRLTEVPIPDIGANEVLVKVAAAGVDRGTWHLMTGRPYLMRILGFGLRRPRNTVAGLDVAGMVAAVGAKVTRFSPGDEVYGVGQGSFAEYAVASEDKLSHKPASLTFEEAAVVPISGMTALQALRDAGGIEAGQKVLIIGASGGVGTYATQLAKAFEAEVTGVASTSKADLVRSLGADHVVDYKQENYLDGTRRYDLIVDIGGNNRLSRLRQALTPTGTLVIVGGEGGGDVTGGFDRQLRALMLSPFVNQRLAMIAAKEHHSYLDVLSQVIERGSLAPAVDMVYGLQQVRAAVERLAAGHARGKIAIVV